MKNSKKGFTLIELLVVVLIIGILAAVALPQYEKSVNKARMAEIKTNLSALYRAAEVYFLAHPDESWVENNKLDIEIPACKPLESYAQCEYSIWREDGTGDVNTVLFIGGGAPVIMFMLTKDGFLCGGSEGSTYCPKYGFTGGIAANNHGISGTGYTE